MDICSNSNSKLENDFMSLKNNHDTLVAECQAAYKTVDSIWSKLAAGNDTVNAEALHKDLLDKNHLADSLICEIKQLEQKSVDDGNIIADQKVEIEDLEKSIKKQKQISD